jgi:hypothetical protein
MGRVQKSLSSHLNQCLSTPPTIQEKCLASILKVVQIELYLTKTVTNLRYPRHKYLDRKAFARTFTAKAFYQHPTNLDLICPLSQRKI